MNLSKLDELKRQQAKLDKIQAEKTKLQAFLNYQDEMEKEKKKKEQKLIDYEYIYNMNAVIIQKYSRAWLARRFVNILKAQRQEQEIKTVESSEKGWSSLNAALDEMRDVVRT